MDAGRKNRDFLKGPVWNGERNRWLVEVRYPDGSRLRRRFRREREALRRWSSEQTKIENGTWHEQAPKTVTFATALKQYREYSTIQNRSHHSYVEPALSMWEGQLNTYALLAKITPAHIEDVKLRRAQEVAHSTVDKDLAVLQAFFNWCMLRNLAASNPVRRVRFFNEDNSRLRYLTEDEYSRLLQAAKKIETSPFLAEKIIMSVHTGLRRGSLFHLRWDQVDFLNRVLRIPRTKSGRPHAATECHGAHDAAGAVQPAHSRLSVRVRAPDGSKRPRAGQRCQERVSDCAGRCRNPRLHVARPAAHLCLMAHHEGRLAPIRRRAVGPSRPADGDAVRAPLPRLPVG